MAALRILLVDDHRVIADSLARLLQDDPAIQVVGIAATGPEAISLARLLRPSLVVMDIGLPGMDGVEATWTIRRQDPGALSRRELEVLQLVVGGADIAAIGRQLMLSPHTIRNHLKGVYRKLGVRGRVEAAAYAVRRGLIKA